MKPFYLRVLMINNYEDIPIEYEFPIRTYTDIDMVLDDVLKYIKPAMRY